MGAMTQTPKDDQATPRWIKLASALHAEPAPDTLARVRRRLASRTAAPSWIRWLARPVALATSVALLVVSAIAGNALLAGSRAETADASTLTAQLLGDDGSFGLDAASTNTGPAGADSEGVER